MDHALLRLMAVLAVVSWNCGCAEEPPLVPVEPQRATTITEVSGEMRAVVASDNAFAIDLYQHLASERQDNLFFAPGSIATVLSMAAEGARGVTAKQFAQVLKWPQNQSSRAGPGEATMNLRPFHQGRHDLLELTNPGLTNREAVDTYIAGLRRRLDRHLQQLKDGWSKPSPADYAAAQQAAAELNRLSACVDRYEFRSSSTVWYEQSRPLRPDYLATMRLFFGPGAVLPINFIQQGSRALLPINREVSRVTAGKIPELLSEEIMSDEEWRRIRFLLTNAVYFRGAWRTPFEQAKTKELPFDSGDGRTPLTRMMANYFEEVGYAAFEADGSQFSTPHVIPFKGEPPPCYPGDGGWTLLELPYKGDSLSMVFILPRRPAGLASLESRLSAKQMTVWLKAISRRPVVVKLPKFHIRDSHLLKTSLQKLGLVDAFIPSGPDAADFSGILDRSSDDLNHYLDGVIHETVIEVNEAGTEAAAATAAVAQVECEPMDGQPFDPIFKADHPFLFLIRDRRSGQILFMGRLVSP